MAPNTRDAGQGLQPRLPLLTFAGAEAVFLVPVVAGGGGTPGQPVRTSLCDAPGVRVALEDEGEVAVGPIGIPVAGLHHCSREGQLSDRAGVGTTSPSPDPPGPALT